jgi:hypothetical protein
VKRLGGDGVNTPTVRTKDQTIAGIYWAYDATPCLGAPSRLYNQIAVTIAAQRDSQGVELARLLVLVNVAQADAAIAIWESKYFYEFWRPVTGIREADPGTGPTGKGDDNPDTVGDPTFTPLGAPASNLRGPNFTPPFPAYPSSHAGLGGPSSRPCATFIRPTTSPSPLSRTSSTASPATIGAACARASRAASRRSRRPRKKTARAASISGCIGPLIRPRGSPRGGAWQMRSSSRRSCRGPDPRAGTPVRNARRATEAARAPHAT